MNRAILHKRDWIGSLEKLPWQSTLARAPLWVSLLLVILIAQAAAEMTWLLLEPEAPARSQVVNGTPATATPSSQISLQNVVNLHLFGEAQMADAEVTDAPIDAPKTSLNLVLRGVFSDSDPDKALAIIADGGGKEHLYGVGDQVPGGAVVHAIYPDRVILQRNGQLETLLLPRDELPDRAVVMSSPRPVTRERSVQAPDKLKEMRAMLKSDPQKLWQQVRIEPVLEEGRIKGYRLFHQDAQLMRALGIQKSDIITEVNGMSLDDPAVLYQLLNELDSSKDIRLTVERKGSKEVIVVHM